MNSDALKIALEAALQEASRFVGATSPNPPVGAAGVNAAGLILSVKAHERAGTAHAEARVIADLGERGILDQLHTLVVTLEPCNHLGRTPPCTEAILKSPTRRVVFGVPDPNPRVAGGGEKRLIAAGIEVVKLNDPACAELLAPFSKWVRTGIPFVTVKRAISSGSIAKRASGSMIPPAGQKTFTSPDSLRFAHELRRRADAILTGSGTWLADSPLFTVRHVPDHPGKTRWLVVLDRRKRIPEESLKIAENRGFRIHQAASFEEALHRLGQLGVLEVLIEAGPLLSDSVLQSGFWDRDVVITHEPSGPDQIDIKRRAP